MAQSRLWLPEDHGPRAEQSSAFAYERRKARDLALYLLDPSFDLFERG
jgi:hypothetical protein